MRFRWKIKELKEATVFELIRALITERRSTLTNVYSPLSEKLQRLQKWLDNHRKELDKDLLIDNKIEYERVDN